MVLIGPVEGISKLVEKYFAFRYASTASYSVEVNSLSYTMTSAQAQSEYSFVEEPWLILNCLDEPPE
jgi:hypothetical protein